MTTDHNAATNASIVRRAFDGWASGTGDLTAILDDDVAWTIVGTGPHAKTYRGKAVFLAEAFHPISARFRAPMAPLIHTLIAAGDVVAIHWDGVADMVDGQTYRNSYAYFFEMRGGKVATVTAFLDLPTFDAALSGAPLPARSNA